MRFFLVALIAAFPILLRGQNPQQKSMKTITDYVNQSAEEVSAVVQSVISYYPRLTDTRSAFSRQYVCPIQLDDFYYNKALKEGVAGNPTMMSAVRNLRAAAEQVDARCKALETYHKLEDYKQDNYEGARRIIAEILGTVNGYRTAHGQIMQELEKAQTKMPAHNYKQTSDVMRIQLHRERAFLDQFRFNLQQETHTGWNTEALAKSISETDAAIKEMQRLKPQLNYPASSMWPSFIEGLQSILEVKRSGLDQYNYEAKKSDKHSNDVYLSLINYYNGVLISDYNTFLGFASGDQFSAVYALRYFPLAEIRSEKRVEEIRITPYQDVTFSMPPFKPQSGAISRPVFKSLSTYVEFINETYRQVRRFSTVMGNLNSSAAYYAGLNSYSGKGKLNFAHKDYEVPLSAYQKVLTESKLLPREYAEPLNKQCGVLLDMLKELDQIGAVVEGHTSEKRYEADHCAQLYQLIERTKVVIDAWDERKETLFTAVRGIFDTYALQDAASSWQRSGADLWALTRLDRDELFLAKRFYGRGEAVKINTDPIDQKLREVIAKEFDNMKGIQKLGRNNGLCPYTPYEDLPKNSKTLAEELRTLRPAKSGQTGYQHPYHTLVYIYNSIVEDYNKFASLSPIAHLPAVLQPELFVVQYPDRKPDPTPTVPANTGSVATTIATPSTPSTDTGNKADRPAGVSATTVIRDTIYIEKRDTIYLRDPAEDARSMEGYAVNNMILLLDVSGSMNSKDKFPLLKQAVFDMLGMMRPEDKISILVFSGKPKVLLQNVSFRDEARIRKAINDLKAGGLTDGNAGIKLACKVADQNYIRGGNNRIIMATDGEFTLENTSRSMVEQYAGQDIYFSVFNFSKTQGKVLQELAAAGKGNYELVNAQNVELKLIREAKAKRQR